VSIGRNQQSTGKAAHVGCKAKEQDMSKGSGKYNNPSFQIARLFRKKSASGNTYFTGRLGGARVSLLKSRDVADDGGEIWSLMIAEAPQRQQEGERQQLKPEARRDHQAPPDHQSPRREAQRNQQPVDDEIPF